MKGHVKRGSGFRGVLNYCLGPSKNGEIVGGNLDGQAARELAAEFGISRNLRPECTRPVWHTSLSLPLGESLTPERWGEAARRLLQHVGMDPEVHQFVVVRHHDTTHEHVHVIASRISLDGRLWHGQREARAVHEATQKIEKEMGLAQTPGPDAPGQSRHPQVAQPELDMWLRKGEALPPKAEIAAVLEEILAVGEGTLEDLVERMGKRDIEVRVNQSPSTARISGLSFSLTRSGEVCAYKASQVAKGYSWANLEKKMAARLAEIEQQKPDQAKLREQRKNLSEKLKPLEDVIQAAKDNPFDPDALRNGKKAEKDAGALREKLQAIREQLRTFDGLGEDWDRGRGD
jgi:hypothetical protein